MNPELVQQSNRIITDPQVLINVISKRVRQLSAGSRPMIEPGARMGLADIAMQEVISGKLTFEPVAKVSVA